MDKITGKPIDRVDGRMKVRGEALYSSEFQLANLCYGVALTSSIAKGQLNGLNTNQAEQASGVLGILTHKNSISLHFPQEQLTGGKYAEKDLLPLQSDRIFYAGQIVAVVVAETLEQAEYAVSLIHIDYKVDEPKIDIQTHLSVAFKPPAGLGGQALQIKRGHTEPAFAKAPVTVKETYSTPVYHHNAMEPHATIAQWDKEELLVYDSTQAVYGTRAILASLLGLGQQKIRVITKFVGGGFGSKGFSWPNTVTTCMAAYLVKRPVKLVLSRQQMFSTAGRRAETIQQIQLGADSSGNLLAIRHDTLSETSFVDEFVVPVGGVSGMLYRCPNIDISHSLIRLNRGTPCPMRGPAETPGTYALEVAMDELAVKLKMDPVALRLINYTDKEQQKDKLFSSINLKECYSRGADAIGWSKRDAVPGRIKQDNHLVGYGMATATYPANRSPSGARAVFFADGHAEIECATQDIGTGTYTIMTQIAADAFSLPPEKVKMHLGDSNFLKGANSGGSQVSASVGPPIRAAALEIISKLIKLSTADPSSPLYGNDANTIEWENGRLFLKNQSAKTDLYTTILNRNGLKQIEALASTNVSTRGQKESGLPGLPELEIAAREESKLNPFIQEDEKTNRDPYVFHSFGAHFVRVLIDPELFSVHIDKAVAVMDIGTVLNLKTAKNQIMGGMIFGIGMALMEQTVYDPVKGRVVNSDLSTYLVPVHSDMPEFDVQFIDKPDFLISPLGARGIGEIGSTGITAAIANAIYNATGKRIRDLPITLDKLMASG